MMKHWDLEVQPMSRCARRCTVLVAEDDEQMRLLLARVLRQADFDVVVAEDGAEAERIAHNQEFDCLLTDVIMPRVDGLSLAARLRELRPDQLVIFISGYVEADMVRKKIPGALLINKPFAPGVLVGTIRRVLAQRSIAPEPDE